MVSLPAPPVTVSFPAPRSKLSLPPPPVTVSFPLRLLIMSANAPPINTSSEVDVLSLLELPLISSDASVSALKSKLTE